MIRRNSFLFILTLASQVVFSQKMEVIRTSAVDRSTPVTNVYVDAENKKWVGNLNGLFQVFSPEQGNEIDLKPTDWSLMQTHDGNADVRVPLEELIGQMGKEGQAIKSKNDRITTATYNESKDELWVGTYDSGLFEFKTKPALRLLKHHHSGNSKIPSNQVNTLFLDSRNKLWVGTYGGAYLGKDGKWDVEEKGFSFSAFVQNGTDVWAMGDNFLWKINSRGSWDPVDIDSELMEGDVADIAFDQDGLLWVVSDIVARVDPATDESTIFGPAIGFTSQDVYCVAVDQNNGVWIGTNDKGLYLIQKASTLYVACDVVKDLSCDKSANDGALRVNVSGGTPPYTFNWKDGLSGDNPSNLGPGEYAVTVSDSRGKSSSASVALKNPIPKLELKEGKQTSPDGTADGSATVNVSGGKPTYSYLWDTGEKSATAFQLGEGAHSVTVTDKNGCSAIGSITIGKAIAGLSASISETRSIKCAGDNGAAIKVEVAGGKEPFKFQWNVENINKEGLAPGDYQVTVTDAIGQTANAAIVIKSPEPLSAKVKVDASATTNNADGKATVSSSGGIGSYKYRWSNGEASVQATKLSPGQHTVTVADEAGCEATASIEITEDILPLSVSVSVKNDIQCAGGNDATMEAEISGGKSPFQYNWSGIEASGATASNLSAGNYSLTITDTASSSATVDFNVKEPKEIVLTANAKSPASTGNADGKASAKANGGTGELTYKWSNGESNKDATKLPPGEHTVTVTDENGCTQTATVSISENILELNVSISQNSEIKCAGDKSANISTEVNGGKGPFIYAWNKPELKGENANDLAADDYSLTVTDAVGNTTTSSIKIKEPQAVMIAAKVETPASTGNADGQASVVASGGTGDFTYKWDNGEVSTKAQKLGPGEHAVTVTDENGCSGVAIVDISENILPLRVTISQTADVKCAGGNDAAITTEVSGGKGPFQYNWLESTIAEGQLKGLQVGSYAVTVTDAEGTTADANIQINEPQPLAVSLIKSRPTTTEETNNGRAIIKVTGGSSAYSYKWDNGETGESAEALSGGRHSVTIMDANGCEASTEFETKVRIIPELSASNFRDGETINLNKIYFQTDSINMDPSSIPTVDELHEFLAENPKIIIEVGGHTNNIPSHQYCDQLSTDRSKSVAQYLVDKGIPASQLRYKGYGKRKPIATNETVEGRAKNQRVEIKIISVNGEGG